MSDAVAQTERLRGIQYKLRFVLLKPAGTGSTLLVRRVAVP